MIRNGRLSPVSSWPHLVWPIRRVNHTIRRAHTPDLGSLFGFEDLNLWPLPRQGTRVVPGDLGNQLML